MNATIFESSGSIKKQSMDTCQEVSGDYMELEYDQSGPVFVQLPDEMGWIKVNNFSACDQCRTSHVKCSLAVTGGPCNHCKSRNQVCKVNCWIFNPEWPPHHIYKPVMPPPPAAPSSPLYSSETDEYEFEWELLVHKLNWLQREAPKKFRKRSSAMPWKDEPNVTASETQNRKRLHSQQITNTGVQFFDKLALEGPVSGQLSKRRKAVREVEILDRKYDFERKKTVLPSSQHRMSISFILSPCTLEQSSKPEKKSEGSTSSSNGWESRRTSLASSEGDWSTRSETRSPSPPAVDSLPKPMDTSNISFRSPPVPHRIERHEILSKFKEWRPPFNPPLVSAKTGTFPTIR